MLHGRLLRSPHPARARRVDRHHPRGRASRRSSRSDRRVDADSVRHPARQPRRARALPGNCSFCRRSRRGRHRGRRVHRRRRLRAHRRRLRAAADDCVTRGSAGASRAAHPRVRRHRQHPQARRARIRRRGRGHRRAADHVFDDTFFFEGNTHLPLEQHAAVALRDPDGKLVVYSSTQTPHYLHRALAKVLEMPAGHIRVIATPNGGGFGGKSDPFNHEVVVAKAAWLLDRPVKICLSREEVFYCHRGRHPVLMRFRTGVNKDGRLTGIDLQTLLDGGVVRLVRRRQHVLHRRAADRDVSDSALPVSRLPRVHEQAAVRAEARPRHAAEPLRPGSAARQDRRDSWR